VSSEIQYSLLLLCIYAPQTTRPLWSALSLLILLKIIPLCPWNTMPEAKSLVSISHYKWLMSVALAAKCSTSSVLHYAVNVNIPDGIIPYTSDSRHSTTLHLFAVIHLSKWSHDISCAIYWWVWKVIKSKAISPSGTVDWHWRPWRRWCLSLH
jgi:hypothetical protein